MRISDWSSDVCSSDLLSVRLDHVAHGERRTRGIVAREAAHEADAIVVTAAAFEHVDAHLAPSRAAVTAALRIADRAAERGAHAGFVALLEQRFRERANAEDQHQDRKSTRLNSSH